MQPDRRTYETLNGLRGIAALAVVLYHYGGPFAVAMSSHAILAVDFFFAISGVIMAHVYEQRLREGFGVARFMLNRLVRLYPLYLAGTLIFAATVLWAVLARDAAFGWTGAGLLAVLVPAVMMLPAPGDAATHLYPLNVPAWSLFYELLANLAFAAAAPRLSTKLLGGVTAACAGCLVWLAIAGADLSAGWTWGGAPIALARVGFSFTAGLLLYRFHRRGAGRAPKISPLTLMVVAAAVLLAPESLGSGFNLFAILLVFPAMIWIGLHNEPHRSRRAAAVLGVISYPLYTLHVPVIVAAKTGLFYAFGFSTGRAGFGGALAATLIMAAIAWFADRWFDRPVRHWLGRITR